MGSLFSLSIFHQALAATIMTWLVTALGAGLVFFTRSTRPTPMDCLMGFSAGVMLASSFWSMLAPALSLAAELNQPPWLVASAGVLAGSLLLQAGDALTRRMTGIPSGNRRIWLLVTSITLHNIPEGLAVGVAFGALAGHVSHAGLLGAWMLAVGIALQNFPEGAAVSLPLRREGVPRLQAFMVGQFSAIVEPLAGMTGVLLAMHVRTILPLMLSFAAGAMISVVISELIPECQRNQRKGLMTLSIIAGFCLMMILDVSLG